MKTPKWTESFVYSFRRKYAKESLSSRFIFLMSNMLAEDFFNKTGIDVKKARGKIILGQTPFFCRVEAGKETGEIEAGIGVSHNGSDAVIKWKGKNGKVILPSDTEIEEGDITFWFEKLAVDSIKRDYAKITKKRVLFDPNQFRFQVEYDAFETDLYFQCYLKAGANAEEMLVESATGFVARWNETSEKEGAGNGVVHNVGISRQKPGFVEISMNLGSALAPFLKQFLLHLNGIEGLERVRLTSYP